MAPVGKTIPILTVLFVILTIVLIALIATHTIDFLWALAASVTAIVSLSLGIKWILTAIQK